VTAAPITVVLAVLLGMLLVGVGVGELIVFIRKRG
jgi:hypothetical protein